MVTQQEFDEAIKKALSKLGNPDLVTKDFDDPIIGFEVTKDNIKTVCYLEAKIKFLEDNAFSDRAKIGVLENKVEELEKTLDHYKKHINEELMVALAPFKYYVNEMISLSSRINELEEDIQYWCAISEPNEKDK